ncbi:phosphatase PAP2 family protein [Micromonospora sp. NPDC049559]|uniref:phosphatase PAP2 family protein n=1 Tax=Micromonospora sp. NPDC049559 TaxID=3155923 RepID=UPI0034227D7B
MEKATRAEGRKGGLVATWLVFLAALQVAALVVVWRFAVHTRHGQWLDTAALTGNTIGQDRVDGIVDNVLNAMSVVSLLAATAVLAFIALIRRRVGLAIVAMLLVAGANITNQVLKYTLARPDFGVDPERAAAGNSFPSGHTSIAASVAAALILVLPRRLRAAGAIIGAAYTALAGVATLSAGWHRPSDAVGAVLVVGAWAAVAGLLLLATQHERAQADRADAHRGVVALLVLTGLVLVVAAAVALGFTDGSIVAMPEDLGQGRLLAAYAGSAAGIAGAACLAMATVLATVHRVVPRLSPRPTTAGSAAERG